MVDERSEAERLSYIATKADRRKIRCWLRQQPDTGPAGLIPGDWQTTCYAHDSLGISLLLDRYNTTRYGYALLTSFVSHYPYLESCIVNISFRRDRQTSIQAEEPPSGKPPKGGFPVSPLNYRIGR